MQPIDHILELARWAPSGDNQQTWCFEIAGPRHLRVHTYDTRADSVYDLDGRAGQLAAGILLETIAIAASAHGLRAKATRQPSGAHGESRLLFDVRLEPDPGIMPSALLPAIVQRTVQRRPMRSTPLSARQLAELAAAVGDGFRLQWLASLPARWRAARLMFANARVRLTMYEAYLVHRRIIDWDKRYSEDRIPDQALGLDRGTLKLMRWAMANWQRLSRINRCFGTWATRLQMDWWPGLACSAHVVLRTEHGLRTVDDYVAAGRALQRFWLTLTNMGYFMQPEMTPLIFARYLDEGRRFTAQPQVQRMAQQLRPRTAALLAGAQGEPFFIGRVGAGPAPQARSVRKPVARLMRREP
jgi:hypothetical protein